MSFRTVAGQISDDELFERLVRPLPAGCRLTAVLDCCHSGHGMDFPYTLRADFGAAVWNCDSHVRVACADAILFSGCEDDECSADAACRYGKPAGARMIRTTLHGTMPYPFRAAAAAHFTLPRCSVLHPRSNDERLSRGA